ncbi:MAG TPA: type II secretion system protein GspE, partial [Polyangiaceae bacterium]|nr:type II secretion system protein GspE [Polyangiaceae bacterium]
MEQRALGAILVRQGIIGAEALEPLFEQQRDKGTPLLDLIVQGRFATSSGIARGIANECGVPFVDNVDAESVSTQAATRLPIGYARSRKLLVVAEHEANVEVVTGDPLDTEAIDDVRASFGKPVSVVAAPPDVVEHAINRVYERQETDSELKTTDEDDVKESEIDILDSDDEAPIIRWVNNLFAQAVKERASDIHIEPEEKEIFVRYRVDGQLYVAKRASRQFMGS